MSAVAILDYGMGNVRSVANALKQAGMEAIFTRDADEIGQSRALIIPGVGAFGRAIANLRQFKLVEAIRTFAYSGRPVLGICLGMQILADEGEEFGLTRGLGLIAGRVRKLPLEVTREFRIPHIGWNRICEPSGGRWEETIFADTRDGEEFYFVHSFAMETAVETDVLATTRYGDCTFISAVRRDNVYGCQFHPEKSGPAGLAILKRFLNIEAQVHVR